MTTPSRSRALWALVLAALFAALPAAQAGAREAETIPGHYVVVYKDSVERPGKATSQRERAIGFHARHRYRAALKGFSARLSAQQVKRLRADAAVDFVAPDRPVHASAEPLAANETVPAGVRRIEAANATHVSGAAGVGVAIIDTGIHATHPDLAGQVKGGTNCMGGGATSTHDDHGHGTHVAGTVAAANTGGGIVGVAPGTDLYAVKVLDKNGSGSMATVACGIDWVTTAKAQGTNIRVANMSLGGLGDPVRECDDPNNEDLEHLAICASTAAGVVYAVAAGNSGWDFDYPPVPDVPAAYPEVVTVSAMTDMDGAPGGVGGGCKREKDDTYASFSNYALTTTGVAHTMAAPGVCVVSTRAGGGTVAYSGTSMATPHVAGALALCITSGECAGLAANQPAGYISALTEPRALDYGFAGDPWRPAGTRWFGYLGRVGIAADGGGEPDPDPDPGPDPEPDPGPEPEPTSIALAANGYRVKGVHHVDLTWSGASGDSVVIHRSGTDPRQSENDGSETDYPGTKGGAVYTYKVCEAGAQDICSETVTVVF